MGDVIEKLAERVEPIDAFWYAPWKFAVHAVVGTLIFATIAATAVALDLGVHQLEMRSINVVIIIGLKAAEYALFFADLVLFLVFLWRAGRRTVRAL